MWSCCPVQAVVGDWCDRPARAAAMVHGLLAWAGWVYTSFSLVFFAVILNCVESHCWEVKSAQMLFRDKTHSVRIAVS